MFLCERNGWTVRLMRWKGWNAVLFIDRNSKFMFLHETFIKPHRITISGIDQIIGTLEARRNHTSEVA